VAAKLFNLYPDNFYNRYVKTGRLRPIIADGRRSKHFFRVEDVESLIEIEKQTIITPKAAKILGVDVSCVDKLVASGTLKPISGPTVDGYGKNLFLRGDVERLHAEREAFKTKCVKEGKTSRFGRPAGPQTSPVQDLIGPRIDQLIEEWRNQMPKQRISGQRLYQQLISEGYQLGIATVYEYLRQKYPQAA
jgi:hypothetical protein